MLAVGFSQLLGKRSFKAELLIGAITIWSVLMLISRVRLGMHYPIDLFVAIISAWIVHLIIFGFLQKKGLFNKRLSISAVKNIIFLLHFFLAIIFFTSFKIISFLYILVLTLK